MFELRPDQRQAVDTAKDILRRLRVVYLAAQMRVGKGLMSITIGYESGYKNICFVTKKMNIVNAEQDKVKCGYPIRVDVVSIDSLHKIKNIYDLYIVDEAHMIGTYAIPSKRAKQLHELIHHSHRPVILMSGTPSAESYSQLFHQFYISNYSPWREYKSFYKWAKDYCKQYRVEDKGTSGEPIIKFQVKQRYLYGRQMNDYSEAIEEKVKAAIKPYWVTLSQGDAGFTSFVEEEILYVPINPKLYELMEIMRRDKVYRMKTTGDYIVADTPVKLQNIFHQLSSGTIKITDPQDPKKVKRHILDRSKAEFIKEKFKGQKIACYFKFIAEGKVLEETFPNFTRDQEEFNNSSDKVFICQVASGSLGVNLWSADCIVMYNIDFSATLYWQVRARQQSRDRVKSSKLYWIFSEHGIEIKIHGAVEDKKSYTLSHFKKDYEIKGTKAAWQRNLNSRLVS